MVFWCLVIILLALFGILQDLDLAPPVGIPYRLSTWLTMLVALGILARIRFLQERGEKEELRDLLLESEQDVKRLHQELEDIRVRLKELES